MDNLYVRATRSALIGNAVFFALIFVPAWTLNYWQGWAFFLTLAVTTTLVTIYLALYDKKLLESRLRVGPAAEETQAQKRITAVGFPVLVAALVIMVLDHRFGWSPSVPVSVSIFGVILMALGMLIYFLVVRENSYAAATVGVAEGQTVVSTGPYAIVRHPMYVGAILVFIRAPLALGSWWGLLATPLVCAGFAWRLLSEERHLRENLPGHGEYMRTVRYRLVPRIW
jgi:protein-S-isoprenylcysteine O-methyltransferase Ste14